MLSDETLFLTAIRKIPGDLAPELAFSGQAMSITVLKSNSVPFKSG